MNSTGTFGTVIVRSWMLALVVTSACDASRIADVAPTPLDCRTSKGCIEFASFETDWNAWQPRAADAGPSTIQRSQSRARDGVWSAELTASNSTADSKLWLQRTVSVQPNTRYSVRLEYAFCCVSYEQQYPNLFWYVADARSEPVPDHQPPFEFRYPISPDDSSAATDPGSSERWRHKHFDLTARAGPEGRLYVSAGLRYGFETTFRYFIDSVRLTVAPLPVDP